MKTIKIIGLVILGIVALFITTAVVAGILFSNDGTAKQKTEVNQELNTEKVVDAPKVDTPKEPVYLWQYQETVDEMDDSKNYFASIQSDNALNFDFPYGGGSYGYITVRNRDGKNDIVIKVEKGQFMSSYDGSEYIRIKFDDGKLENYTFNEAADGSSNVIFPNQSSKLIKKIMNSKSIKIEAPFYNEGRQVLNFNTEGLKWDK